MPTATKDLSWGALLPPIFAAAGIDPGSAIATEPLTGGVSSDIVRVRLADGRLYCAKRALSQLKVAAEWQAPVERNHYEVAWLRRANAIAATQSKLPAENPFLALSRDPRVLEQHYASLRPETDRVKGRPNESLVIAVAKMADFETIREASEALTDKEVRAVLNDRKALAAMMAKAAN